jgi:hypothetical protein
MERIILYVHIGFLCVAGLGILLADYSAVAWLRGKRETIDEKAASAAHWIVSIGLSGIICSGLFLFWPLRFYVIGEPLFWVKMGFVLALAFNSFVIEKLMPTATHTPFRSLSRRQQLPFLISGAVSTVSWIGAFLIAITIF